ncbi:DEAD/DEAH box helicase [Pseudenhygromyxa sp. WMMC2535]|uniref:Lhr family helicase n=1 Tax=Pseudenhygromyxa sp. WMMC2535 TaxID=2712867 RepID=UPI001553376B|nr:DEAD/DEAH box helicase [Pseudenhygromyxa sp. WMMC2535]NVB39295.1 DEAD/DEAH box helicase [Pseudenhygromyxa sp. WMMC2535]
MSAAPDPLGEFHPAVREWFGAAFPGGPTLAQQKGWPSVLAGNSSLLLAPTGSGKTLAAFLVAIDRLMFEPAPEREQVRVLYISPLKALGVDVERNLRAPLAGIAAVANRRGEAHRVPTVGIRSGDTPQRERARMLRHPPDILITTPESLFLLLTSQARQTLRGVDTVIVDEIHSMVASKRGAHLFASLERLEHERGLGSEDDPQTPTTPTAAAAAAATPRPSQRIGLSATQRPLDEVARLLGGYERAPSSEDPERMRPRPVTIIDAGRRRALDLVVEVPVEDMARLAAPMAAAEDGEEDADDLEDRIPSGPAAGVAAAVAAGQGSGTSIWPSIHPRLVELIESHRSTMLFVNNRSLAERLSQAINTLAGRELSMAHHGSVSKDVRAVVEDRLKRGDLPAIVATSSLELGIDMGAVDLVVQIEAPPSVASGLQRVGRAGHQVGGVSAGVLIPKYRHDLLACAAVVSHMREGLVEPTYYPRNPLDVLAQQLVAMVAMAGGPVAVEALWVQVRRAAPFAELGRRAFEGTLDMLAGRYPSNEFAELRPRLIWDRLAGTVEARKGAQKLAVTNAGTIPDRGLYGVFMLGEDGGPGTRVGELDEEMVFESREGDVFVLGASSWKIAEITRDRVIVTPAPGESGRMPFWHGEGPGRPPEFGRAIGALGRELIAMPRERAEAKLRSDHALDTLAARNLVDYLHDQREATGVLPSDEVIVVERWIDEIGDWRVAVLSPFGARVHAPWATAIAGRLREGWGQGGGLEVDMLWTDEGMAFRLPETDTPPPAAVFFPGPDEVEHLVVENLAGSALFAARFRENAARALLLPRRQVGKRTPLWMQRKRSADLLQVATRYRNFPIILETYRECLRDVFDLPALTELLRAVAERRIRVREVETRSASPFAASVVFSWVGQFLYDDDQPRAERRAQALALDYAQLRELLGDAELRELLDRDAVDEVERLLQRLDPRRHIRDRHQLHDALRELGALSREEIVARAADEPAPEEPEETDPARARASKEAARRARVDEWIAALLTERRAAEVSIGGVLRSIAAEDAGRYRDALGVVPPMGLPLAFLEVCEDPLEDLVARYARTHVPFTAADVATRLGLGLGPVRAALERLRGQDRLLEGEFMPGGREREWCDVDVLRRLKRASLAKLSAAVEAVEARIYARFLPGWHRIDQPGEGLDDLLGVIEQLQGIPLPASDLERAILPARLRGYQPGMLDQLCAMGELRWRGVEGLGKDDGKIALYLTDHLATLSPAPAAEPPSNPRHQQIRAALGRRGAMFFADLEREVGGFGPELLESLWELVWAGEVSNDTLAPLRARARAGSGLAKRRAQTRRRPSLHGMVHGRRSGPPGSEGRWFLLESRAEPEPRAEPDPQLAPPSETERATATAIQLLERYGVVTREAVRSEGLPGGFSAYYPLLKAMEAAGKIRRGYFVAGMGGAQFGLPGAEDRLREEPEREGESPIVVLAACDPANAWGAALPWPRRETGARPQRAAGAHVFLHDGHLLAWLSRSERHLLSFVGEDLHPDVAERERLGEHLAAALVELLHHAPARRKALLLEKIDDEPANEHPLAATLVAAGFRKTHDGLLRQRDRGWAREDPAEGAPRVIGVSSEL